MRAFLEGSGRVGTDLLAVDWDSTPLGAPEQWPQALRNSVRILLTSKFSMWLAWGPELTFFCNDAYRRDTLGKKYPWALGRPASEVWSEIWPDIGPRIDRVTTTGEATWDEQLQLFLERSGFVEETYHTFSYSPLAADDGSIAGMLCVVKEDTEEVIAARRMATIRDLGIRRSGLTETETLTSISETLAENVSSLPFTLVYRLEPDGRSAVRVASTGFSEPDHPAAPAALALDTADLAWPLDAAAEGRTVVVDDLEDRFDGLPTGGWPDPPQCALVVPLVQAAHAAPYGFLVAGVSRYRPLDDGYRGFVELIASHLSAALTDARAYEFERERAETLARLDRAKTDFFTNVSHEFRTPLTLLLGPAEDALADDAEPLTPRQRGRLEVIHRNGQRLLKQVNSLLDFSRLESGKVSGRFEQLDLARYTVELATMFDSAAEAAGIRLVIDCEPLPTRPYVDAEHWAKIVLNLMSNALKFTFEGTITVRLREVDGAAELSVADTGVGIPESELPHLFERFHRVPGSRSRTYEGSGIGLALVAELAALHGGTVSAESTLGQGTTFRVTVPLGATHLPPDLVVEERPSSEGVQPAVAQRARGFVAEALRWLDEGHQGVGGDRAAGSAQERPTVLVVDDNADMRDYVAALLSEEYAVVTAADGLDALAKIDTARPDLVLTDVMMPRLDGFGLLERLQADPATTGVPVIMLSARGGEEGTVEGLDAGADDYLVKPFSARELLARVRVNLELDKVRRVRAALERSQSLLDQAQRLARVGSWEIDLATGELRASEEMKRLLELPDSHERPRYATLLEELVREEDRERVRSALEETEPGSLIEYEVWVDLPSGRQRLVAVRGEAVESDGGRARLLRGSVQDVTERRRAEEALAAASAKERAAEREHAIADELQRSLLPERTFEVEHLDVATFYRAGVEGTHVGGDWYDIIELGAGRTALVVGDVMGRGVRAAAGMGQLRSAVRAFSKLDLPPAEMLEYLDGLVQDMGGDQIVTCFYAIFDSTDQTLRYANAGHLPALLAAPGERPVRLSAAGPPLGAGYFGMRTESVRLALGTTVVLYTDGLVERRSRDIDVGIDAVVERLESHAEAAVEGLPELLVDDLLPEGPDDDIAILVARVDSEPFEAAVSHRLVGGDKAVAEARRMVSSHLRAWEVGVDVSDEVVLMASELVTNAFMHGRAPIDLRLRRTGSEIVFEVQDRAVYRPRRRRAADDDEHGRGLHIVSVLADRWGSRATGSGKSVWFSKTISDN